MLSVYRTKQKVSESKVTQEPTPNSVVSETTWFDSIANNFKEKVHRGESSNVLIPKSNDVKQRNQVFTHSDSDCFQFDKKVQVYRENTENLSNTVDFIKVNLQKMNDRLEQFSGSITSQMFKTIQEECILGHKGKMEEFDRFANWLEENVSGNQDKISKYIDEIIIKKYN